MADIATLRAIRDNIETVCKATGINFEPKTDDDITKISVAVLPLGGFKLDHIEYEYDHGQKPGYAIIFFNLWVIIRENDDRDMIDSQLLWADRVREALTAEDALRIGALASSNAVSEVRTEDFTPEDAIGDTVQLNCLLSVRYREA